MCDDNVRVKRVSPARLAAQYLYPMFITFIIICHVLRMLKRWRWPTVAHTRTVLLCELCSLATFIPLQEMRHAGTKQRLGHQRPPIEK